MRHRKRICTVFSLGKMFVHTEDVEIIMKKSTICGYNLKHQTVLLNSLKAAKSVKFG